MTCVDASVAAKWIFPEEYSLQARNLVERARASGEPLIAPPLLPGEVNNVIRQRMRREGLSIERARERMHRFLTYPVVIEEVEGVYETALSIAHEQIGRASCRERV